MLNLTNYEMDVLLKIGQQSGIFDNLLDVWVLSQQFTDEMDFINSVYIMAHLWEIKKS